MDSDAESSGITTLSLLIFIVVGTGVAALVGFVLDSTAHGRILAILSGLAGTIVATIVRRALVVWGIGIGPGKASIPLVLLYSATASLVGGLTGYEIAVLYDELLPLIIGGLAGLLSSILMGLLVLTYQMPER